MEVEQPNAMPLPTENTNAPEQVPEGIKQYILEAIKSLLGGGLVGNAADALQNSNRRIDEAERDAVEGKYPGAM
jgi:hypothetical protein